MAITARRRGGGNIAPTSRAAQWSDIDPVGQRNLSSQMRQMGNVRSAVPSRRAALTAQATNPENNPRTTLKAEQRGKALEAIAPHFENKPMTLEGAASHRVELARAGARRSMTEGVSSGANWYYEHHQKLADVASSTGIGKDAVIAASASMSPQNSPDQEHAAVKALSEAHSNPHARVRVTHEAVDAAKAADPENAPEHERMREYVGHDLHPRQLESSHLAMLSNPKVRGHVDTTGVDLGEVAKGGVKSQVTKAVDVLRGNIAPEKAISPITSPKVWSYHQNIAASVPGTAEQQEFLGRAHAATTQIPGQGRFDLTGLQSSTQGQLTERGHTAEDSWMHAINTRQRLESVNVPGRTGRAGAQSPAKFAVGEGGGVNKKALARTMQFRGRTRSILRGSTSSGLEHAWSNQATNQAAQTMGMPSTAVQAMSWTEGRRRASKDPAYEAMRAGGEPSTMGGRQMEMFTHQEGGGEAIRQQARPPRKHRTEQGIQQSLF